MTDCPHNDHTHTLLWVLVLMAVFNSMSSCGGDMHAIEQRVQILEATCRPK